MKRQEVQVQSVVTASKSDPSGSIQRDMHFVHKDGPSVKVTQYVIEGERGTRFTAELTAMEAGVERAIIDATSSEELALMLEPAARAFALAVRLRVKAPTKPPIP